MNSFCKLQQSAGALTLAAVIVCSSLSLAQQPAAAPPSVETLHIELRALKDRAVKAVNERDKDALFKELSQDITLTVMNNDVVHGLDKVQTYYDLMLTSSSRFIEDMSLKEVEADELSHLYAGNQVAVASGKADAHFKLVSGKEYDWPLRWTGVLTRSDNKWAIVALHFSANAINNPLISAASSLIFWIAAGVGFAGIAIGYILARLWSRRATAAR
jgi:ketosteroid isomerase-like protein